tara:strand:- start:112 stop:381 length:270 start_codon:yes stop_codon:yes gene_type:complete
METVTIKGHTYQLQQVDSTTVRRVPVGKLEIGAAASKSLTTDADDLTEIKGVGAKKAEALNEAGIFTFEQLANSDDKFAEAAKAHIEAE